MSKLQWNDEFPGVWKTTIGAEPFLDLLRSSGAAFGKLRLLQDGRAELTVLSGELNLSAPVTLRSTGREVTVRSRND